MAEAITVYTDDYSFVGRRYKKKANLKDAIDQIARTIHEGSKDLAVVIVDSWVLAYGYECPLGYYFADKVNEALVGLNSNRRVRGNTCAIFRGGLDSIGSCSFDRIKETVYRIDPTIDIYKAQVRLAASTSGAPIFYILGPST